MLEHLSQLSSEDQAKIREQIETLEECFDCISIRLRAYRNNTASAGISSKLVVELIQMCDVTKRLIEDMLVKDDIQNPPLLQWVRGKGKDVM
jgi:hypothetical protein